MPATEAPFDKPDEPADLAAGKQDTATMLLGEQTVVLNELSRALHRADLLARLHRHHPELADVHDTTRNVVVLLRDLERQLSAAREQLLTQAVVLTERANARRTES